MTSRKITPNHDDFDQDEDDPRRFTKEYVQELFDDLVKMKLVEKIGDKYFLTAEGRMALEMGLMTPLMTPH